MAMLLLFLLLQLLVMGTFVVTRALQDTSSPQGEFIAGRDQFVFLQGVLLVTCLLFLPIYTGIRLAAERSDTNVDLLYITTLKPRAIVAGKFWAALLLAGLIFSACTPFMCFSYLLRGIDALEIILIVAFDFFLVAAGVLLAILIAVFAVNRAFKVILGLLGCAGLCMMLAGGMQVSAVFAFNGLSNSKVFWGNLLAVGPMMLSGVALLYFWSVAIVSPPASNRMLPMRLYLFCVWVVLAPFVVASMYVLDDPSPITGWVGLSAALFIQGLLIAINEREQWSPRVARKIPRRLWLRVPAFLLYSGAAGGVLYCSLLLALTYLAVRVSEKFIVVSNLTSLPLDTQQNLVRTCGELVGLLALYAYSYCMSAVWIRRIRYFRIKPLYTWIVALGLILAGTVLPLLLAFFLFFKDWNYVTYYQWLLTNPISAVMDTSHRWSYLTFVGCWAAIVTLLNLPWFARQMRAFRPYHGGLSSASHAVVFGPEALDVTKSAVS
jgi:hypothetical protein